MEEADAAEKREASELPLGAVEARQRIGAALGEGGLVLLSDHAVKELEDDEMDMVDVRNILRGGAVHPAEWEGGEWRYRVLTPRMGCVISFESETNLVVVTGWRNK